MEKKFSEKPSEKKLEEQDRILEEITQNDYEWGFETKIAIDALEKGLNEHVIRQISKLKDEPAYMLEFRLDAFRKWKGMQEPHWAHFDYAPIDYQDIIYYAAPKSEREKALDNIDPELLETFKKLGIELDENKELPKVAVDAIMDSVSVKTMYSEDLAKQGILFCSISEAIRNHPDLIKKYLGSVVPSGDNFFSALNSAVFSDGSFVYIPKSGR